jgi:hypothetical protein
MKRAPPVPVEAIAARIVLIRGQKVLLDADLAALYGVETRRLNEQVRRNLDRFPADFMFSPLPNFEWVMRFSKGFTACRTW